MSDVLIRIREDGTVAVEDNRDGIRGFKEISPDSLLKCINQSLLRGRVSSGLLPKGCLSFAAHDNGDKNIVILHPEDRGDISYFGTEYKDFPLPRLVFGFHVSSEGCVSSCRLGVIAGDTNITPKTAMYHYPLSNVSGFHLCTGNNTFPKCPSLHTLGSLPYYILSMPNNQDYFKPENNKQRLEMRDLLELLRDKEQAFYYSDVLLPNSKTLSDFINGRD